MDTISEDLFEWDDNCLSAEKLFVDFLSFQEEESKEVIASKDIVNDDEQEECEGKNQVLFLICYVVTSYSSFLYHGWTKYYKFCQS